MTSSIDFSVVIATFGRAEKLRRCLAGLARMRIPQASFEVIVVDDGSPVPVREALGAMELCGMNVRHIRQQNLGPGMARNAGVAEAKGRWIAFIDDDCIPHRDWLNAMKRALESHPEKLVGGRIVNGYPDSLFDTASWVLLEFLYDYLTRIPAAPRFFASMNIAMSRDQFLRVGGFGKASSFLAEDRDLCDRWTQAGEEFHYEPRAAIRHHHGLTLRKFWRQHFKYGRGARRFHLARAARRQQAPRIEPWGFYLGLVTSPLRLKKPLPWRVALMGCMVFSQVAMVCGYYWDAFDHRREAANGR